MEFSRTYTTIDAHTAGEPLRIVTGGVPFIPGDTILEKRRWVRENLDHVRRALMLEPRGHADMYGAFITPPVTDGADLGVIFMHNEGYSDMCGHGVIALAAVAVQTGMVQASLPETRVGMDSPAGFIEAFVAWDGRKAGSVRFRNVPSFLHTRDLLIDTPSFGRLTVDVAFGGAFYAYLSASQAGLTVRPAHYPELIQLGFEVKQAVMNTQETVHPLEPELRGIYGAMIDGQPFSSDAHQSNICVFAHREVDRSPTGTGTAGRVAQLFARGQLGLHEVLVNESIIGTRFTARALSETRVGDFPAVIPEVCGRASIVGFNTWVVEADDPVQDGFMLR